MTSIQERSPYIYQQLLKGEATADEYVAAMQIEVAIRLGGEEHAFERKKIQAQDKLGMIASAALCAEGIEIKGWESDQDSQAN